MHLDARWKDSEPDEPGFLDVVGIASQCPHPDLIFSASAGALEEAVAQKVNDHVAHCPACSALLQALEDPELSSITPAEDARVRNVVFNAISKPVSPPRSKWLWFAIPAFATVAAAAVLIWYVDRDTIRTPSVADAPRPAPRQMVLALEKAPIELPAAALIFRGTGDSDAIYAQELTKALAPYKNDDHRQAIAVLEPLAREYPRKPEASFYLGVSLLLAERAGEGIPWLEKARPLFGAAQQADASWYLAVAFERTGDIARAAAELQDLCASAGPRQATACRGAAALKAR